MLLKRLLDVNLAPERHLTVKPCQVFYPMQTRLVELQGVNPGLDQVGDYRGDFTAGMHNHAHTLAVGGIAETHEPRLEYIPPGSRIDH